MSARAVFSRRLADAMQREPLAALEPVQRAAYTDRQTELTDAAAMTAADRALLLAAERSAR